MYSEVARNGKAAGLLKQPQNVRYENIDGVSASLCIEKSRHFNNRDGCCVIRLCSNRQPFFSSTSVK